MALQVVLNGKERSFEELRNGCALSELVTSLGFRADRVAVERNGAIAARSDWPGISLQDGDRLEVVHFVGGGLGQAAPVISKSSFSH